MISIRSLRFFAHSNLSRTAHNVFVCIFCAIWDAFLFWSSSSSTLAVILRPAEVFRGSVCPSLIFSSDNISSGANELEHATPLYSCHGVFIDRFIFREGLLGIRLPWECHNQSQDTNWRHCVTGPELPFFHKRKVVQKMDQSVKLPWHRLSTGVACS